MVGVCAAEAPGGGPNASRLEPGSSPAATGLDSADGEYRCHDRCLDCLLRLLDPESMKRSSLRAARQSPTDRKLSRCKATFPHSFCVRPIPALSQPITQDPTTRS